jgi:hypothetical protein
MKKLLIITGPQGSGNHFFSRVLSMHPAVEGWEAMLDNYWIPSDQEPFAEYWVDPDKLTAEVFHNVDAKDYFLANVSCPFFFDGTRHVPKILEVAKRARMFGVEVEIAIIVRDQNINQVQQLRVRKEHTTPIAQDYYYNVLLKSDIPVHFLDHEAFFLHKEHYIAWVGKVTGFPVETDPTRLMKFVTEDANHKYVKSIDNHWLDDVILAGCRPTRDQRINTVEKN